VTWTTIPRWLYENDLPDDELQRVYVEGARRKLAELREERKVLEAEGVSPYELQALDGQIGRQAGFLAEAEWALGRYRRRLPGA
jgi:hypothetical protein